MKPPPHIRITGLTENPPLPKDLAMKDGYAICDTINSQLFLYTVRPSRAQSWDQFCKKERRAEYKRQGFRCVPVMVKEYGEERLMSEQLERKPVVDFDQNSPVAKMRNFMNDISEDYFQAGWLIDLEYILWHALNGGPAYGIAPGTLNELRRMSEEVGGWIVFSEEEGVWEVFVPMKEWLQQYQQWEQRPRG